MNSFNQNKNKRPNQKSNIYDIEIENTQNYKPSIDNQMKFGDFSNTYEDDFGFNSSSNSIRNFENKFNQQKDKNKFSHQNSYTNKPNSYKSNISKDEFEFNIPLEFGSSKRRSNDLNNPQNNSFNFNANKNFNNPEKFNENNNEEKNYKLLKKIKKGEIDDEVEIINSYAKGNNAYLPIEEYCN